MLGADIVTVAFDIDADADADTDTGAVVVISDQHVPWTAFPHNQGILLYPVEDLHQDWVLLGSQQTEDGTVAVIKRNLIAGDPDDRDVSTVDSSNVLFAYGRDQPRVGYHKGDRGVGGIYFGDSYRSETQHISPDLWDSYVDLMMPNITLIADKSDAYAVYSIDLGENQDDAVTFSFDAASSFPSFVHHFFAYACDSPNGVWQQYREPFV